MECYMYKAMKEEEQHEHHDRTGNKHNMITKSECQFLPSYPIAIY